MNFPVIEHIDDLLPHIENNLNVRVKQQANGYTVVCYTLGDDKTFSGKEGFWERECRGITFYPDGKIAHRPLHKFFNVGEREETQAKNLDWSKLVSVQDKRDGSMIQAIVDPSGKVLLKTKKSFESDVAKQATVFIEESELRYIGLILVAHKLNLSITFEFTSPKARIVLPYQKPELKILHIRHNVFGTYHTHDEVKSIADAWGVPVVDEVEFVSAGDILARLETEEDKEGYIFQFANGDMVKAKTKWYLQLHKTVTFTRERDVVEMILNETIDDYKSYLSMMGATDDMKCVLDLEYAVIDRLQKLQYAVEVELFSAQGKDRKSVALEHKNFKYFKLLMQAYSGLDPDYKDFFRKNWLREYSLNQIGFSTSQEDE